MTYNRKIGKKKITIDEIFRGYFSDIRIGTLKNKLGNFDLKGTPKYNMPVYKFSNGAMVIFFDLPPSDENEDRIYGIGFNKKASQAMESLLGMTFQDYLNITKHEKYNLKKIKTKSDKDENDEIFKYEPIEKSEIEHSEIEELPKKEKTIGIADITENEYGMLFKDWGDGKTGGDPGNRYTFKNLFKRIPFENNLGKGYKYSDGIHTVYLIDLDKTNREIIIFEDERSFKWAKNIGMLEPLTFLNKIKDIKDVYWTKGNPEELPEGKNYD